MKTVLVILFLPAFIVAGYIAQLPQGLVRLIVLVLAALVLSWLDEALTGGKLGRGLDRVGGWVWRRGAHRFSWVPAAPAGPAPVPLARRYRWVDPITGREIVVDIPPAAVYDYHDPAVHEYVGKTVNTDGRHIQHVENGRTFVDLPRDVQWYPCECVALAVEREVIRTVHPVQNIQHAGTKR